MASTVSEVIKYGFIPAVWTDVTILESSIKVQVVLVEPESARSIMSELNSKM
jgi:hypothetical protein